MTNATKSEKSAVLAFTLAAALFQTKRDALVADIQGGRDPGWAYDDHTTRPDYVAALAAMDEAGDALLAVAATSRRLPAEVRKAAAACGRNITRRAKMLPLLVKALG